MPARKIGSYRPTPEWWKELVRQELKRRGRGSRSKLAKFVPCATSMITQLLAPPDPKKKPSPETSRIAARVAEWTGIPLPDAQAFDGMAELHAMIDTLDGHPELVESARSIIETLAALAAKKT